MAALAARTELSFAQQNRSSYALEEEVTLHLDTKNVGPQVLMRFSCVADTYPFSLWFGCCL